MWSAGFDKSTIESEGPSLEAEFGLGSRFAAAGFSEDFCVCVIFLAFYFFFYCDYFGLLG